MSDRRWGMTAERWLDIFMILSGPGRAWTWLAATVCGFGCESRFESGDEDESDE